MTEPSINADPAYDTLLAHVLDHEAATAMEAAGYDMRVAEPWHPAFRERATGVWSMNVFNAGIPFVTLLSDDWDDLLAQLAEAQAALEGGGILRYLVEQADRRHAFLTGRGMPCVCPATRELERADELHLHQLGLPHHCVWDEVNR